MSDLIRPLGEYLSLLEQEGLLAGPVPDGLDRSTPVALVSCDSRNVVPGTLFLCKGSIFGRNIWRPPENGGPSSTLARRFILTVPSPACGLPICAGPWPCWPTCATATPPGG